MHSLSSLHSSLPPPAGPTRPSKLSVGVIHSHGILRQLLVDFARKLDNIEICGEAATHAGAVELVQKLQPSMVLLDWSVSDFAKPNLVVEMRQQHPGLRVLVVNLMNSTLLREALEVGVNGFVDESESLAVLDRAIRAVTVGRQFFCANATRLLRELATTAPAQPGNPALTQREIKVLQGVARGRYSKEVAADLGLSVFTVENIRRRIMKKTGLRSVAELTLHAVKQRWVPSPDLRPSAPSLEAGVMLLHN